MNGTGMKFQLLEGLTEEQAAKVLALGQRRQIPSGTVLAPLGGEANSLFLVERGRIGLSLPLNLLGEQKDVFLEEKCPGETVGWSALVPPHRFTLTALAGMDSEVLALERAGLFELFRREREVGMTVLGNLTAMIGERLHKVQAMWAREIQRTVNARLGTR